MPRKLEALDPSIGQFRARRQADLARWFGVSLATVRLWAENGMPGKPGNYPVDQITRWVFDRKSGRAGQDEDDEAKRRLNEIKARSAEIDLQVKERSYVPLHYVREILSDFVNAIRRAGEKLHRDHGPQAVETIQVCLDDMVEHEKRTLAEWGIESDSQASNTSSR